MGLQDMAAALAARDAGIEQSTEHCELVQPGWAETALDYLRIYAASAVTPFTGEAVREWAETRGFHAASARAWGGVIQGAKHRGEIEQVGYAPTKASNGSVRATYTKR